MGDNGLAVASRSTQELLTEFVQTGRQEPFEEIVRRYAGMVYHTCFQVTRDKHDAEDAAQAVFLTLAVKSKTTPPIRYLGPWLQQVAKRLSLDLKRSKKRREAREARHHAMNGNGNGQHHDPPALQVEELKRVLHDELQKLPAKYRMPLILHYFGGLKPDEMAKELGCKPSTLGVRLYRGRKLLAESLAGRGISMGTALLGVAIVAAVQSVIGGKIFGINSAEGDAQSADGENLIKVAISARVLGLIRSTTRGMVAARIKSVVALLLLLGGAAGAGQISGQLQPIVEKIDHQIQRLLRPLMRTLNSAIEYSLGLRPINAPLAPSTSDDDDAEQQWRQRITGFSPVLADASELYLTTQLAPIGLALNVEPPLSPMPAPPMGGYGYGALARRPAPFSNEQYIPRPSAPRAPATLDAFAFAKPQAAMSASIGGTIQQSGGVRTFGNLTLDPITGDAYRYEMSGGQMFADRLVVGDRGRASFHQSGGYVGIAGEMALGNHAGAHGMYVLSGAGELNAQQQTIGNRGTGVFNQLGGVNRVADTLALGKSRGGDGSYNLSGGELYAANLHVGVEGKGSFNQSGGRTIVGGRVSTDGEVVIAKGGDSEGSVNITDGTLASRTIKVGQQGEGSFVQTGGTTRSGQIVLGMNSASTGAALFSGGQLQITNDQFATQSIRPGGIVVGAAGDAKMVLGSKQSPLDITERPPDSGASMIIRATASSDATLQGWGKSHITGPLTQNGRVIADAFGRKGSLDFSSVQYVTNTIDNQPGENYGWFARGGAALILPSIRIERDGTHTWGENPADDVIDLINSVRFTVHDVRKAGKVKISLLANDHQDLPALPQGESFVGIWSFDRRGVVLGDVDLTIRYDDLQIGKLGSNEAFARIWVYDGHWQTIPGTSIDPLNNLISGTARDFSFFGVSVPSSFEIPLSAGIPEPSTFALFTLGAAPLLLRRRRRPAS